MRAREASAIERLRAHAIGKSLFRPLGLKAAIDRLGFVQADPIRAPARAQDLILRHRVKNYRAGDLERRYPLMDLEEDLLYAYGFLPRRVWQLIHPRRVPSLMELDEKILATVQAYGRPVHPRDLDAHFGRARVVNDWGGYSKATKTALERLHLFGLTRVARREAGVRIYETAPGRTTTLTRPQRFSELALVIAGVLEPVPEKTLHAITARYRGSMQSDHRKIVQGLVRDGRLERGTFEGVTYLWPASTRVPEQPPRSVKFLAPFDPVVWDRLRFEHLWGWSYRFEAYTPPAKRVRGYYALPMLWGDAVIGWANANLDGDALRVELGFVGERPKDRAFRREADAEIARMEAFLNVAPAAGASDRAT